MEENKTLWIARDKKGMGYIYNGKPWKNEATGTFHSAIVVLVIYDMYPTVTWENSPMEAELILK